LGPWILGQSQPRVSRHLKLLCQAGLLDRLPQGTWVYFRTSESGPAADLTRSLVDAIPADDPLHRLDQERLQEVMQKRAERAAEYFRHNAAQWDEMRALYIDEAEVDRVLKDLLPPDSVSDLLDLGTGTGRMASTVNPASPPNRSRAAIERTKTPGSSGSVARRTRSPSRAPPDRRDDGSTAITATLLG